MAECTCVPCGSCYGTGRQWVYFQGVEGSEPCDDCRGSGLSELCDRCQDLMEQEA